MFPELSIWLKLILAFAVSLVISYLMTPPVKGFAEHVGAIDVPQDDRRVHDHPIPRMGGLAIFLGFVLSLLIFVPMDIKVMGLLLGALIIAVVTFFICYVGLFIGKKAGTKLAGKAGILGGAILIFIGLEIFITSFF